MAELKFRALDKCLKKIVYSIDIPSSIFKNNEKLDLLCMFTILSDRYKFMQYLGVGCQGVELYEGDIVQDESDSHRSFVIERLVDDEHFCFCLRECTSNEIFWFEHYPFSGLTVIGNIYFPPDGFDG